MDVIGLGPDRVDAHGANGSGANGYGSNGANGSGAARDPRGSRTGAEPSAEPPRWQRAVGLELLGQVEGSGLQAPTYLVRRRDGQTMQVSQLLHLILREIAPGRTPDGVASAVSSAFGRTLPTDGLLHVLETKLQPLGLVRLGGPDGPRDPSPRAQPLLALSLRGTILPAPAVRAVSRVLRPLYWAPVVVAAVLSVVVLDVYLWRTSSPGAALQQVLAAPTLLLALWVVLTVGNLVHELGHATACSYGGADPGKIGVGVYLLFPAFFTDVTDSYRLRRSARIRVDLGGLYFNVLSLIALGLLTIATGNGIFLIAMVIMHLEMVQQLPPAVRLDGYYVLSDLAGVPDLFARIGPVLRSLRPGAPTDPRVAELRPYARRIVVAWVLVVTPALIIGAGWLVWNLPFIVGQNIAALTAQWSSFAVSVSDRSLVPAALGVISLLLLLVPLAGVAVLVWRLLHTLARLLMRVMGTSVAQPQGRASTKERNMTTGPSTLALTASDFRDELMFPRKAPAPELGWRHTVYRVTGNNLNLGPGPEERRRIEVETRLRAPIVGSRRVVVMSRKGGVGKTTMALALGSTFASLRGDRVIAVDANPDAGNLAHRVAPPNGRSITDVLSALDGIDTYAQLREYTAQADVSRLEVLASDDDPRIGMALDREDYHRLIGLLDRFYNLIVLDTGTGILDSANQGLLTEADQVVLVTRPGIDGGRAAALTLDWLEEHDYEDLVRGAVVVVNAVRRGVGAPLGPIVGHFERRCQHVVTVPWDPELEKGAETQLSALRDATRAGLVEVAAAVADGFAARRTDR